MPHIRSAAEAYSVPHRAWDTPNTSTLLRVYAMKPLPPLPPLPQFNERASGPGNSSASVPQPLKIKKKPSARHHVKIVAPAPSSSGLSDLREEVRNASSRSSPSTPISIPGVPSQYSRVSPAAATGHQSSKKVLQLMGHDIDVMDNTSQSDDEQQHHADSLSPPDSGLSESFVPFLEADLDGMSSKTSSWTPSSPISLAMAPFNTYQPMVRHSSSSTGRSGESDSHGCDSLHDDSLLGSGRWDPCYGQFSDIISAGEYHKFAVELATVERKAVLPLDAKPKRRSSMLNFSANSQFSRRHRRPHSSDPPATSRSSETPAKEASSSSPAVQPPTTATEPEPALEPCSAFDSDSDDEQVTRGRWRKVVRKSEERGRDSPSIHNMLRRSEDRGRESPSIHNMLRRSEESSRSRAWPRTGDQMKELLASAKDKARGLPTQKADRRREQLRKDIKVLMDSAA